jgi:aminopeptidase N
MPSFSRAALATAFLVAALAAMPASAQQAEKPLQNPPRQSVDLRHIRLELTIDEQKGSLEGRCTLTVRPLWDNAEDVVLHAEEMQIKKITRGDGRKLRFEHEGGNLTVFLGDHKGRSEEFDIVIDYAATPRRGIWFVRPDEAYPDRPWQVWTQGEAEESHYWFPVFDFPSDRATSEEIVTVRKPFLVVGNGELMDQRDARGMEGWHVFHWKQDVPHVPSLVSLVIGDYAELKGEADGVPLRYYVQKKDVENAMNSFRKTPDMIRFFGKYTGEKYPYAKYAQTPVEGFMWGGMENISATTLTQTTIRDERAMLDDDSDGLVGHELAHQWFGDLITCRDWSHIWLNEGFATYFESLFTEHDRGVDQYRYELYGSAGEARGVDYWDGRPMVSARYEDTMEVFDGRAYARGGWVLHMLRGLLGDRDFQRSIQLYVQRMKGRLATTADLRSAMEDASGQNLEWFFDQWVYRAGHPVFEVSWKWDEENKMAVLRVKQTQKWDAFRMPARIALTEGETTRLFRVMLEGRDQAVYLPASQKPSRVRFDDGNWILKELTFDKEEEEWLHQLAHDPDVTGRIEAVTGLARYPSTKAVAALVKTLREDSFYGLRIEAAKALAKMGAPEAREALLAALSSDKDARVRRQAAASLADYRGPDDKAVAERLKDAFRKDLSYKTQAEALKALAKHKPADLKDVLKEALGMNSHEEILRRAAFECYGEFKEKEDVKEALPLLMEWAAYGKPARARTDALQVWAKLRKGEDEAETARLVLPFLEDKNFWMRNEALSQLEKLKQPFTLPAIIRLAENDPIERTRMRAKKTAKAVQAALNGGDKKEDEED